MAMDEDSLGFHKATDSGGGKKKALALEPVS